MLMNYELKSNFIKYGQQGITLLELLISTVIGLFILGVVLGLFVSMIRSDTENVKAIQLNQELRGTMSLISRDIRRAGANQNAAVDATGSTPSNPFSVAGTTRLSVAANQQGDANSCVTYSYDSNQTSELYGFRLDSDNNTVETRANGAACDAGGWDDMTDNTLINIETVTIAGVTYPGLRFAESTVEEAGIQIRQITIVLSGSLVSDSNVTRTISETVKVRNDWF
jgi:prepilin peptidase dependent protein B